MARKMGNSIRNHANLLLMALPHLGEMNEP